MMAQRWFYFMTREWCDAVTHYFINGYTMLAFVGTRDALCRFVSLLWFQTPNLEHGLTSEKISWGVACKGEKIMKRVALVAVLFGLLSVAAATSQAHEHWDHHHGYYSGRVYYPAPVVVAPAPVVVAPAPVIVPYPAVVPAPYYYGVPGVTLGYRGHGVRVGVHF
jgi:hypothetical protein